MKTTAYLGWAICVAAVLIGSALGNVPVLTGVFAACACAAYGLASLYAARTRAIWRRAVATNRTDQANAHLRRRAGWITLTIVQHDGTVLASTLEQLATDITPPDGVSTWLRPVSVMLWYGDPDVPPTIDPITRTLPPTRGH